MSFLKLIFLKTFMRFFREIVLIKRYKSCVVLVVATSMTPSKHDDKDILKASISRLGNTNFKNVTTNDSIKHNEK